jgi:hypothetical protein
MYQRLLGTMISIASFSFTDHMALGQKLTVMGTVELT